MQAGHGASEYEPRESIHPAALFPLPVLDPHTMSGKMLMALLDELMATASIVGRI
jgi:hypothetical protein